jgi:hypothetical protein
VNSKKLKSIEELATTIAATHNDSVQIGFKYCLGGVYFYSRGHCGDARDAEKLEGKSGLGHGIFSGL